MEKKLLLQQHMIDNAPFPMAVYTGEHLVIELANPAMIRAWGKGEDVIGKKYIEVVPEIQQQQIYDQAVNAYQSGIAFHAKDKRVDLVIDGTTKAFFFNYSFIPLFNPEGKVYGIMNTGLDVTDLHEAHLQRRLSDERLRVAIEASQMGTYEIDLPSRAIKTSEAFNTLWSVEGGEISNDILLSKMHPDDLVIRDRAHLVARKTGNINYQARIMHPSGARWIQVSAKILNDPEGIPSTIIGITQDIHQQKQFEQELRKQVAQNTEELRRSNEDLLHFAHVVSHDLKEPLRKIQFFNGFLQNAPSATFTEKQQKYIAKIDHSCSRMQNIIEGILSYSTINSTSQPIEMVDLNEIINHIRTDLELVIQEKKAVIQSAKLPPIQGATILIHQLFYNLMHNALKFSKSEQPPFIEITAAEDEKTDSVAVTIKDNGIGIDSLYAEKIFNAFERLHSKDHYEGNGLGLSLCRKIAIRHHGTITAQGQPDKGTAFTVTLPLKQQERHI